jgi:hypothetical protein
MITVGAVGRPHILVVGMLSPLSPSLPLILLNPTSPHLTPPHSTCPPLSPHTLPILSPALPLLSAPDSPLSPPPYLPPPISPPPLSPPVHRHLCGASAGATSGNHLLGSTVGWVRKHFYLIRYIVTC